MIRAHHLIKTFDPSAGRVLDDISFFLEKGQTLAVIGPSGCGKTTLLYLLAGLNSPCSGCVEIKGKPVLGPASGTSVILQDFGLFPWKTLKDNVELGLKLQGFSPKEREKRTRPLLEETGLMNLSHRYPVQLSGGQKQRVAIVRALSTNPDILLMDEPFSSLDALTREKLQDTLVGLWRKKKLTFVIVTHSVEEAIFLGQFILVLTDRPAKMLDLLDNREHGCATGRTDRRFYEKIQQVRSIMGI